MNDLVVGIDMYSYASVGGREFQAVVLSIVRFGITCTAGYKAHYKIVNYRADLKSSVESEVGAASRVKCNERVLTIPIQALGESLIRRLYGEFVELERFPHNLMFVC